MECYIALRYASNIEDVAAAIRDQPYGLDLLMVININANLAEPEVTLQLEAIVG